LLFISRNSFLLQHFTKPSGLKNMPPDGSKISAAVRAQIDPLCEEHEANAMARRREQFLRLKQDAQALLKTVKGLPGIAKEEQWLALLRQAGGDIETGKFLLGRLGAKRYLDPELMAALCTFRQGLLADIANPATADIMLADSAIIAYRQMLRVQEWIDSICLVIERHLFGQDPLQSDVSCQELIKKIDQLQNDLLPLLEKCQRMMLRSTDRLRGNGTAKSVIAIGQASQVNVAVK
jgi:hypothetical protein